MPTINNISYDEILNIIQQQLMVIINDPNNSSLYSNVKFKISIEQQFIKIKDKDPNAIYIVVKFGSTSVNFGQSALPITITLTSQQNNLEVAQQLMIDYVQAYNLVRVSNNSIQQVYESPQVSGNFSALFEGWRSLVRVSGVFVISKTADFYTIEYKKGNAGTADDWEEIPLITTGFTLNNNPDTQVFFNNRDFTKSLVTMGSFSLNFSTFILNNSWFVNKVVDIICECYSTYNAQTQQWTYGQTAVAANIPNINNDFILKVKFKDQRYRQKTYKLVGCSSSQELGEIPVISLSFME